MELFVREPASGQGRRRGIWVWKERDASATPRRPGSVVWGEIRIHFEAAGAPAQTAARTGAGAESALIRPTTQAAAEDGEGVTSPAVPGERGSRLGGVLAALLGAASLLAGDPALAATSQTATSSVSVNIAPAIEVVSWPPSAFTLSSAATPGTPVVSQPLNFTVKSNASWGIQVQSDSSDGRLREFDTGLGAYVMNGKTTNNSLQWGLTDSGPWTNLSSSPVPLFTAQSATGEAGASVAFLVRFTPTFSDQPLTTTGHEYRIQLTYTAAVGY